jgi:hypothetical protein
MDTVIESLPRTGQLQININVLAQMNYSAYAARRRVSRFAADEISMFMRGGEPALVVADRLCWRVPVVLILPGRGNLGSVGAIDVDVETGQLYLTPQLLAEIQQRAGAIATLPSDHSGDTSSLAAAGS